MRYSGRVMLLLAMAVGSWVMPAAGQTTPRSTTPRPASKPATTPPRAAARAASADPFIGVWRLSAEKSKYESGGAPRSFVRTYEDRGGGTILMITDAAGSQGATRAYLAYKRDGKSYPEAAVGAAAIRMVTVRAINPRTEELSFVLEGSPAETFSTITLSADGMTMTQVLKSKNAKGKAFTNTLVFDKQP
jgi:hypothetical protein